MDTDSLQRAGCGAVHVSVLHAAILAGGDIDCGVVAGGITQGSE